MSTSAEQIHHGKINLKPETGPDLRLYVNLDICSSEECKVCDLDCSYFYHPENNGIISVSELAAYTLVCRKCEDAHCVLACPTEALEQVGETDKVLTRHAMRCVACKSCSHACPYGTIYPEYVPQLIHICDFCLDRKDNSGEPRCIKSCEFGALELRPAVEELEENSFLVGDNLIVHSSHWMWEKA